jgi:hypothetical protein
MMIKETLESRSARQKEKFYFCRRVQSQTVSDRQNTLSGESAQFLSLCPHPDGWVWVHNLPNWLAIVWGKDKVF